jgi:hypothetical protein
MILVFDRKIKERTERAYDRLKREHPVAQVLSEAHPTKACPKLRNNAECFVAKPSASVPENAIYTSTTHEVLNTPA